MPDLFYPGGKAKQDDVEYYDAVKRGYVGENCWLGGPRILELLSSAPKAPQGKDVCAVCPVGKSIRAHCGGRPENKATEKKKSLDQHPRFVQIMADTTEALKARSDQQNLAILLVLGKKRKDIP